MNIKFRNPFISTSAAVPAVSVLDVAAQEAGVRRSDDQAGRYISEIELSVLGNTSSRKSVLEIPWVDYLSDAEKAEIVLKMAQEAIDQDNSSAIIDEHGTWQEITFPASFVPIDVAMDSERADRIMG